MTNSEAHRTATSKPGIPWFQPSWRRVSAAVLAAGALAAAITSLLALLPKHDVVDRAEFKSIFAKSPVPLGEYQERTSTVPRAYGILPSGGHDGFALVDAQRVATPDNTAASTRIATRDLITSPKASPVTPTKTAGTMSATPSASPSPAQRDTKNVPPIQPSSGSAREALTAALARVQDYDVTPSPASRYSPMMVIADNATVNDQSANPVSTDVAAERIADLLRETRTRPVAGRKKEPLGVLLTANVELVGLRGQGVLVTWRIYPAGGTTALFGKWLGTTAAYRLVAGTDDDTTAFDLWVPLPNVPGQYTVNLSLTANGANLASEDSPPFK